MEAGTREGGLQEPGPHHPPPKFLKKKKKIKKKKKNLLALTKQKKFGHWPLAYKTFWLHP
jgi:hypothetical protein